MPEFMPIARRIGPLTMSTGPTPPAPVLRPGEATGLRAWAAGTDNHRAAGGPPFGKLDAEPGHAGHLLPLAAVPADGATDDFAVSHPQQRRHRLDAVMPGITERSVVDDARAGGERRVVLAEHGERGLGGEPGEHGSDERAGRALALDEGDEAGGQ